MKRSLLHDCHLANSYGAGKRHEKIQHVSSAAHGDDGQPPTTMITEENSWSIQCAICRTTLGLWSPHVRLLTRNGNMQRCHLECVTKLLMDNGVPLGLRCSGALCLDDVDPEFTRDLRFVLEMSPALQQHRPKVLFCYEERRMVLCGEGGMWPPLEPRPPPVAAFAIEGIREIRISSCSALRSIPPEIGLCLSMKALVLISNSLTELPTEVGKLQWLDQLFLNGNFLRSVPNSIGSLQALEEVCFDANRLDCLPRFSSTNLTLISAPANRLEHFPQIETAELVRIEMQGNYLSSLPLPHDSEFGKMKILKIMGNRLTVLPEALGKCYDLRAICVAGNLLKALPSCVVDLKRLEWLFAYNNMLQELPTGMLTASPRLDRVLLEGNPIDDRSLAMLSVEAISTTAQTLALDTPQVRRLVAISKASDDAFDEKPLPTCIAVGNLVHDDASAQYYMKLMRASQLRRKPGCFSHGQKEGPTTPDEAALKFLVVAFSASQGEPEWLGVLRRIANKLHYSSSSAKNKDQVEGDDGKIVRNGGRDGECRGLEQLAPVVGPLAAMVDKIKGTPPCGIISQAEIEATITNLWAGRTSNEAKNIKSESSEAVDLTDFDVLSVIDHRMQWYCEDGRGFHASLEKVVRHYQKVMFVGASMGGFGALLHGGALADTVVAFGPQTRLDQATLRPPAEGHDQLETLSVRCRESCRRGRHRGALMEIHCATDEHLWHGLSAPLGDFALTVHPINPCKPFARVLDRAGILETILADAVYRTLVRQPAKRHNLTSEGASVIQADIAADDGGLSSGSTRVLLACWYAQGQMDRFWASRTDVLRLLCNRFAPCFVPRPGDWLCAKCQKINCNWNFWCHSCGIGAESASLIHPDARRVPGAPHHVLWTGDWGCGACGVVSCHFQSHCASCGRGKFEHERTVIVP